ncbi:hypothetical protein [Bradyrhizobium cosmicum]|uniref:hypothetical protein n=2 Tax=Bradyrhizobium TaxID=374 RepID=UPI0028EE1649|nr:hypothetical protein [Bradyrhizobium cosmicum]
MKQCGFLRRTQHNRVAEACREKLSAHLPGDFFEAVRDAQIAPILLQRPPKNLFVQAGARPKFGNELPALSGSYWTPFGKSGTTYSMETSYTRPIVIEIRR